MTSSCRQCNQEFEITESDLAFYEKMSPVFAGKKESISPPTLCPDCRNRLRMSYRNERKLYNRTCAKTGKAIISVYSPDKPFVVYDREAWWADDWDAIDFGRPYDFSRSFTEQFRDLQKIVPRMNMMLTTCENCDYAPYSVNSKNCYLCVSLVNSEDVYYSYQTNFSRNCLDSARCLNCELCYECLYCINLYDSQDCSYCENSSNLYFCQNCKGCSNLIGCSNLSKKEYCIFNKQVTKEEFLRAKEQLSSHSLRTKLREKMDAFFLTQPQPALRNINCEDATGDNLVNCRNVRSCFDAKDLEDCAYIFTCPRTAKDNHDMNYSPNTELCFNCMSGVDNYNTICTLHSWNCKRAYYCDECFNSSDLFGCIGLRNKQYCILNKQYTKEEYEDLVPRIIESMRKENPKTQKSENPKNGTEDSSAMNQSGLWGEFFDSSLSPFGYGETMADEYCPLGKEEALKLGFNWSDYVAPSPSVETQGLGSLPDSIQDVSDDILKAAIQCEVSGRPFKIIKQELQFYREHRLPLPRKHPDIRHLDRMKLRNPRKLFERNCMKCGRDIQTTYSAERKEIVYCEECYLKEVY